MATHSDIVFRASSFFDREFSFSFRRMHHTPQNYNESTRHRREFWKIIYVVSGRGEKIINDRRYPLQPGGLFLIHPDDSTTFVIKTPQIEICNILFLPELLHAGLRELSDDFGFFSILQPNFRREQGPREQLYIARSDPAIDRLIRSLEEEDRRKQANQRCLIRLNLLELLIRLGRKAAAIKRYRSPSELAAYVEHIIGQHFRGDFCLDYLANQCGVSKPHLCRIYRASSGRTIMERVRERRLQEAERMLREAANSVSSICYACGFNDLSYFYRAFAARTGMNPGEYRRKFGLH